jgi:nucleoside-diphosphate-sugar epimerase
VHNVQSKKPDISKAAAAFGHNPQITLEQGVPRVLDWMKTVYADSLARRVAGARPV